jgi:hypothetical protein
MRRKRLAARNQQRSFYIHRTYTERIQTIEPCFVKIFKAFILVGYADTSFCRIISQVPLGCGKSHGGISYQILEDGANSVVV